MRKTWGSKFSNFVLSVKEIKRTKARTDLYFGSAITRKIMYSKAKSMQRSGTEAIRTQIQPSKPKREITNITK